MPRSVTVSESATDPSTFRIRPASNPASRTHSRAPSTTRTYHDDDILDNQYAESAVTHEPGSSAARSAITHPPSTIRNLKPSQRKLIDSYRNQLLAYERERASMLDRIDDVDGHTGNERMQLRNAVKSTNDRVYELQRALSDAHVHLYNERKLVIQTQQQNSELNARYVESNKRVQHLLAMTAPVQTETTYFVSSKPMSAAPHPSNRHAQQGNTSAQSSQQPAGASSQQHQHYGPHSNTSDQARMTTASERAAHQQSVAAQQQSEQVADHTSVLNDIIKSLRKQLKQQAKLHAQEMQAYIEDRALRETDIKHREDEHRQALSTVIQGVKQVEDRYRTAVRETLQNKAECGKQVRELNETIAALQGENSKLRHDIVIARDGRKHRDDSANEQQRVKQSQAEEDLAIVKQQYEMSNELYEKRVTYLTDRLNALKQKHDTLRERRDLEYEGFSTDYKQIRERVRQLEHVLVQVKAMMPAEYDVDSTELPDALSNKFLTIDREFQALLKDLGVVAQRLQLATT